MNELLDLVHAIETSSADSDTNARLIRLESAVVAIAKYLPNAGAPGASHTALNAGTVSPGGDSHSDVEGVSVVEVDGKSLHKDEDDWRYSWKLTLRNDREKKVSVEADIRFLDSQGFAVEEVHEYNLKIPPRSSRTFSGTEYIRASIAASIDRTTASIAIS